MKNLYGIDQLVSDCKHLYYATARMESTLPDGGEELCTLAAAASHLWQALEYLDEVMQSRVNGVQLTMEMKGGANGTRI